MIERFDEQEIKAVTDVIRSGKLSSFFMDFYGGEQVQAFEKEFAEYVGARYAISVSNGTVALEIALKALGIGKGDEVITTPLSFAATSTAILAVGATPVFVDIRRWLTMNVHEAQKAINSHTKAFIPVSLLGMPTDLPCYPKPYSSHFIPIIEDSAQALGSTDQYVNKDKKVGSRTDLSTFSFQETKQLSTLGEGGMITTNDTKLAEICKHIRNHGNVYGHQMSSEYVCTNARMTEAAAAFGRVQLRKLPVINENMAVNAKYFMQRVNATVPFMKVLPEFYKQLQPYLLVPFTLEEGVDRENLIGYLKAKGVGEGIPGNNVGYYKQLIYELPIFKKHGPNKRRPVEWGDGRLGIPRKNPECPVAEEMIKKVILFDIHRWQYTTLIDKCLEALKEYKP